MTVSGTLDTSATGQTSTFTTRPTNTAVLYCIKYEPTYFMNIQGMIEETTLWEGDIGTSSATSVRNSINLSDSVLNYDKIGFHYRFKNNTNLYRYLYQEVTKYEFELLFDAPDKTGVQYDLSFIWAESSLQNHTDILPASTENKLYLDQLQSYLTKIVGIKYKTTQS